MSNGTFGNNFNGPINPNRTVGVSRLLWFVLWKNMFVTFEPSFSIENFIFVP